MYLNKTMTKALSVSSLFFCASFSMAEINKDIALIRSLAPQNYDLAKVQAAILTGGTEAEALQIGEKNYLYQDVNKDSLKDLIVILEENPTIKNFETEEPCEKVDYSNNCHIVHGPRVINIYLGQKDGSLKLALSNATYVLGADEGGVWGDPLEGLSINKKQAFSIHFYGGSNWRWGYSDTVQFRNGDFYVIGKDSIHSFTGDGQFESKSENLLTGMVIQKSAVDGDAKVVVKKSRVSVKPLEKFSAYKGQAE